MPQLETSFASAMLAPARRMRLQGLVLFCHFLSAFTALGMPLFLPRMLSSLDPTAPSYLVGVLFAVPAVGTALAAAWWGRFADRYGRRTSLLRAQLGLCLGFLIAGFSTSVEVFVLGLVVQGACGGTLAASNAYLSSVQQGKQLAQSLNYTQMSARLALLLGPIMLGLFTHISEPLVIYRYLALLPLVAFLIALSFPEDAPRETTRKEGGRVASWSGDLTLIVAVQFLFCFAMVVTFPYFLQFCEQLGLGRDSLIGLLYSLPHLVYLLVVLFTSKLVLPPKLQAVAGLVVLSLASLGHALATIDLLALPVMRLLFGLGMVLSYSGIHRLVSDSMIAGKAGLIFGRLDASGKWAGVTAGLIAGALVASVDPLAPFIIGAVSAAAGALLLILNRGTNA